jgi:hypothetical protein
VLYRILPAAQAPLKQSERVQWQNVDSAFSCAAGIVLRQKAKEMMREGMLFTDI